MAVESTLSFHEVFAGEIESINKRRARAGRPIALERESTNTREEPVLRPTEASEVVGLSLSGGGVRSAAYCLGVLQALHRAGALDRFDYLSTVSGGGYMGASLSAAMTESKGEFPFESKFKEDETPSLQHLRDYSNYLFPHGSIDVLHNSAIYARGLVANVVLIMPWLLFAAAVNIHSNKTVAGLQTPNVGGFKFPNPFSFHNFVISSVLGLVLLVIVVGWGVVRSFATYRRAAEVPNRWTSFVGLFVLLVLAFVVFELQPFILLAMFQHDKGEFFGLLADWVQGLAVALAPLAAAVAFLAGKLGPFIKDAVKSKSTSKKIAGYAGHVAIYLAAAFVPLLLWAVLLQLSYWGINEETTPGQFRYRAPVWIVQAACCVFGQKTYSISGLYSIAGGALLILSLFLRPNANSLHPLYRDRLRKAFLFAPRSTLSKDKELDQQHLNLSALSEEHIPYHLINCALNVQNSKTANRRGRDADFFLFSRNFVGSQATGYITTREIERQVPELDLATAIAVSGAAASSSMGSATIKPLTPTLAILNIRVGYWMRNPSKMYKRTLWNPFANFYFVAELLGRLSEKNASVYLTDGGHIENLGLYELLRRRCAVIVAVDAEADPEMQFSSLMTLERYARIDLGVRIHLNWWKISQTSRHVLGGTQGTATGDQTRQCGPHCSVGQIEYPDGRKGTLIYIKASLSGDENDYILDYKRRYPQFPHETTLDQLFSEEQFEVYRALGFHAAYGLFDRSDEFEYLDAKHFPSFLQQLERLKQLFPRQNAADGRPAGEPVEWVSFASKARGGISATPE